MNINEKIKEIADGYALLTHKNQGWEGGASMSEYLLLREQAIKEMSLCSLSPAAVPVSTVKNRASQKPVNTTNYTSCEISPVSKAEETAVVTNDLDILKALGE